MRKINHNVWSLSLELEDDATLTVKEERFVKEFNSENLSDFSVNKIEFVKCV